MKTQKLTLNVILGLLRISICSCIIDPGDPRAPLTNGQEPSVNFNTNGLRQYSVDSILAIDTVKLYAQSVQFIGIGSSQSISLPGFDQNSERNFFDFHFGQGKKNLFSCGIQRGDYERVILCLRKVPLSSVNFDEEFRESESTFNIVIKGKYRGADFIFRSSIETDMNIGFNNTFAVGRYRYDVTLKAYAYKWFFSNGFLLDPNDQINRSAIEQNILTNKDDALSITATRID